MFMRSSSSGITEVIVCYNTHQREWREGEGGGEREGGGEGGRGREGGREREGKEK